MNDKLTQMIEASKTRLNEKFRGKWEVKIDINRVKRHDDSPPYIRLVRKIIKDADGMPVIVGEEGDFYIVNSVPTTFGSVSIPKNAVVKKENIITREEFKNPKLGSLLDLLRKTAKGDRRAQLDYANKVAKLSSDEKRLFFSDPEVKRLQKKLQSFGESSILERLDSLIERSARSLTIMFARDPEPSSSDLDALDKDLRALMRKHSFIKSWNLSFR